MRIIGAQKKKINPYKAGQYALIAACWLFMTALVALPIVMLVLGGPDGWIGLLIPAGILWLVATSACGMILYEELEEKAGHWTPEPSD